MIECLDETYNNKKMYPSVEESLQKISAKEGYKTYTIFKRLISTNGGNYFGDLYEVDIKGETNKGVKETNLFVKHAIKINSPNNVLNINSFYRNEIFVYTELRNICNNLQDEAGIPYSERFKIVKSFDGSNEDAIILENLSKKAYETRYRMDGMTLNFAEISIKQVAKFHALSFVLKAKKNNYYNNNIKTIYTPIEINNWIKDYIKRVSESIFKYFDKNIQGKIRKFIATINEKLPKYLGGETSCVKCLCHGDFRINNILFKENSIQDKNMIECLDETYNNKKMYPSVEESLQKISAKEGYKTYTIFKRLISTNGGNYFGDLYEVDIKGETNKGVKETNLFVKHAIKINSPNDMLNINSFYRNEIFVYTELRNICNNLQDEAGIPYSERFKIVKSFDGSNEDAIILENLSKKAYETRYRMDGMTLNFAEISIKQIAKFHALSFVLKAKKNNYYNNNIKTIYTPIEINNWIKNYIKRVSESIFKYFDKNIQGKIRKFIATINEKLPKYLGGETSCVKCLCHGDFRINNILFKENGSELSEAILIDYQLLFFGSPVLDLIYFIYSGTDKEFRKAHMENLKDIYHDTLRDYLKYFDIDVDEFYSKKIFLEDFNSHLDYGLMVAFYVLPFCFTLEDAVPDISKDNVEDIKFKFDERFIKRLKGIIDDYLEWVII